MYESKREEVTGGWRRLHNEELHKLYNSPNIISYQTKEDELGGACSTHGGDEKRIQNFGRYKRIQHKVRHEEQYKCS
jgi:hypothetical protein